MKTLFMAGACESVARRAVNAAGSDEELSGAESFIDGAGI